MNDEIIEAWLRKAPAVTAPPGLQQKLQSQIRLPHAPAGAINGFDARPWLRRWLPALSFAALLLGCFVVVGVQTTVLTQLRRENETLRAAAQPPATVLPAQNQDPNLSGQDTAELERLRQEVAKLKPLAQEADSLRAENARLRLANADRLAQSGAGAIEDALAAAKAQADRAACVNNLMQIGLAFRVYSDDKKDIFPDNFLVMSNELNSPKLLICPGDTARTAGSWADVAAGNVSYRLMFDTPGAYENFPNMVIVKCPIHNNFLLADGSVQMLSSNGLEHLKTRDGKTFLEQGTNQ